MLLKTYESFLLLLKEEKKEKGKIDVQKDPPDDNETKEKGERRQEWENKQKNMKRNENLKYIMYKAKHTFPIRNTKGEWKKTKCKEGK